MSSIAEHLRTLRAAVPSHVRIIAVSKTKPVPVLQEAYAAGQRDFGENYVQEITGKAELLPPDVCWHFIGHLQSNKVKYIAPFVQWIHAVDSIKLLQEIQKQAARFDRTIDCLLQVHIAREESKFGWNPDELRQALPTIKALSLPNVRIRGLMGMASFTPDEAIVRDEFRTLSLLFRELQESAFPAAVFSELSMGMSSDWKLAVEEGSTMVRIGSAIFGSRS